MPTNVDDENNISNNKKALFFINTTTESLDPGKKQQLQQQEQKRQDDLHRGENSHSKNTDEQSSELEKELNNEHLKLDLKAQIKDELEEQEKEQKILLKENKQNIIDFIIENKDAIKMEDLKIYGSIYKCYREKGNCQFCNSLTNIVCNNCTNYNNEVWLCTNHWKHHLRENHQQRIR